MIEVPNYACAPTYSYTVHTFLLSYYFQLLELCALDRINQLSEVDCYVDILHCQLKPIQLLLTISEYVQKYLSVFRRLTKIVQAT